MTAADGTPSIALQGLVGSGGYFLLERSDDCTVDDLPADLIYTGALEDSGETLLLYDAQGAVVDAANGDGGPWPAGSNNPDISMERIVPLAPGEDGNWATHNGMRQNGIDCNGGPIAGTPQRWNSVTAEAANLRVHKTGPDTSVAGSPITYTLAVRNLGVVTAAETRLADRLPPEMSYLWDTAPVPAQEPIPGLLVWSLGDLLPGSTGITFTLVGLVQGLAGTTVTNVVSATSSMTESIPGDNVARWGSLIVALPARLPDLQVSKTGPISAEAGSEVTYALSLANSGALPAPGTRLTDVLPVGVSYVRDSAPYSLAHLGAELVVWDAGEVPTGSPPVTFTLTAWVSATAGSRLTNTLIAVSRLDDAYPLDNLATCSSVVVPRELHSTVLIDALLYDGLVLGDADEAVRLWNLGPDAADLSGWLLSDGSAASTLPAGTLLAAGDGLWLARDAGAFAQTFGLAADVVLEVWPGFSNAGDECLLRDSAGNLVDAVTYKDGEPPPGGWMGPTIWPYAPTDAFAQEGQILYRKRDQDTGLPTPDTDSAADWAQDPSDLVDGRRVQYPGWDLDAHFFTTRLTETATVTVAVAPDNLHETLARFLRSARSTIHLELYGLDSISLTHILTEQLAAGVGVTAFLEGSPVGGLSDQARWAASALDQAGAQVYFLTGDGGEVRARYGYQHAKMAIVDGERVALGTQNWNASGMPYDGKGNGTEGQRGVTVFTDAPGVVAAAEAVWAVDLDPEHHADVVRCEDLPPERPYCTSPPGFAPLPAPDWTSYTVQFTSPLVGAGFFGFEWIQAPENSLRNQDALLGLLARAGPGDRVLVEQCYEHPAWGAPADPAPNPRLEAYLDAARRGAEVALLLDGFESHDGRNQETVDYVTGVAKAESLPLQARLGNPTLGGIHNKMVLAEIDGRGIVHIGSLNGGEASHKLNRELALQIEADAAYAYLAEVFAYDWSTATPPVYLPQVLRNKAPPPPPDHVVITEILYAVPKELEWVEIHNPTAGEVSLEGWRLGDAATPGAHEGMYLFPAGIVLPPQGTLVVAVSAAAWGWGTPDLELYDTHPWVPDMIRDPAWGDGEWELASAGDEVVLLDALAVPVDVVTYGAGSYPGVIPHPGVEQPGYSLGRVRAWPDTNDCSQDFSAIASPGPGIPPP